MELSAYRIVQEALDDALRHAPGATARIEIGYVLGGLGLRIVNGPAQTTTLVKSTHGAGHGITGMRERVTMLDGEMTTGETDDGGYEVTVFLPVPLRAGGGIRMTNGTIRVLIADDDQVMVREGFSVLLGAMPDIEVVGEAVNGRDAVERVRELGPDVVLMDIRMPEMNGIEATRAIVAADSAAKVLVLTTFDLGGVYRRCAREPRAFCSRTPRRVNSPTGCGWWRPGRRCSPRP